MKIYLDRIPQEGATLEEKVTPSSLDLDTDLVKFLHPIVIRAEVSKITNTVTVELSVATSMHTTCSRCLEEFDTDVKKSFRVSYPVSASDRFIDLSRDIREEIVLDSPLKPLCTESCRGLCPKCGKNFNQGKCNCKNPEENNGTTKEKAF